MNKNNHKKKWDIVVIGAGLGGLSAAATLAQKGKKVLIVESQQKIGGYAHCFEKKTWQFDASLHALDGGYEGGWTDYALSALNIKNELRLMRLDPFYRAIFPSHDISVSSNMFLYESELVRHFPSERTGLRALFDNMHKVYLQMRRIRHDMNACPQDMTDPIKSFPELIKAMTMSWEEFLQQYLSDMRLKGIISAEWIYYGLPPSRLSAALYAATWISYHFYGAWYPQGGSDALCRALQKRILESGGEILTNHTVKNIVIENNSATGIVCENDEMFRTRGVISNADSYQTIFEMIDSSYIPSNYRTRIEAQKPSLSTVNIYAGIDAGQADREIHEYFILDAYDPEVQYESICRGNWEKVPLLLVDYNQVNKQFQMKSKNAITIMALAPWEYAKNKNQEVWHGGVGDNYVNLKNEIAHTFFERVRKYFPPLKNNPEYYTLATPRTNYIQTKNKHGAIFGSEQSVENMFLGRLDMDTPIENLMLAGAWTSPGGGQSAALISGIDSAHRVLKVLEGEPRQTNPAPLKTGTNKQVPNVSFVAMGSGKHFSLQDFNSVPLAIVIQSPQTAKLASKVNARLREKFPANSQVSIVNVVHLKGMRWLCFALDWVLRKAYKDAAKILPDVLKAEDYVIISADYNGDMAETFGIHVDKKSLAIVLIDRKGRIETILSAVTEDSTNALCDHLQWM